MAASLPDLLRDLSAETDVVLEMVSGLDSAGWDRATPAQGWAIRDQISHLAYFDECATMSVRHPARFRAEADKLVALGDDFPDQVAERYRKMPPAELLAWFCSVRTDLVHTFSDLNPRVRLPWYGPDMSAASSITARIMETWAHGQDIADALGLTRSPTARLRHVAHLGVSTFAFAHTLRGVAAPETAVRVELMAEDGALWTWGPEEAEDVVRGPALDFCLVVTQRRHVDDTSLKVSGAVAQEWIALAQAFAGAPGPGREPGQFPRTEASS